MAINEKHLNFMVLMRALSVDGRPVGEWRWWYWMNPTPGGSFTTAEEAEQMFKSMFSSAEWEYQIFEIVARRVK